MEGSDVHHGIIRLQAHCVLKSSQQEEQGDPWLAEGSCRLQVGQTILDYKALLQGKETVGRKSHRPVQEAQMWTRDEDEGTRESRERTGLVCSFHGQLEGPNCGKAAVGVLFNWPGKQLASLRCFLKR